MSLYLNVNEDLDSTPRIKGYMDIRSYTRTDNVTTNVSYQAFAEFIT